VIAQSTRVAIFLLNAQAATPPRSAIVAKPIFVRSSSAAKAQVKALIAALTSNDLTFLPWWEAFTSGKTLLGELDAIREKVQGAILVLTPDVKSVIGGGEVRTPNLNVLFEFGYSYGHFGSDKVAVVRYGDVHLPSDLDGYIHITGSTTRRPVKVDQRTIDDFNRWVSSAGIRAPKNQMFFVGGNR
jgi:predicted nucleotide-binding protein